MTSDQAAQLIAQNEQLLQFYKLALPLLGVVVHDIVPAAFVAVSAVLGAALGWAATS